MILRILLAVLVLLVIAAGGIWLFGPREPADLVATFDPAAIGPDPAAYLARSEADIPNLRPEAAKEIVWAYPASRAKTPLAIVYLHGFSASKDEIRPLPDEVAAKLGANLYFARLAGHGRDGAAMAEASVKDWMDDYAEAMAIGRAIGERVVVIGNSTGGTLAVVGASRPELSADLAGLVLISPNFAVRDRWAFLLDIPFAREIGPWIMGETHGTQSTEAARPGPWTTVYPTVAYLPMGALMRAARGLRIEEMTVPAFFLYSPADEVVNPAATEAVAARWGAPHEVLQVTGSTDPSQHILAGDLVSPGTTDELATRIAAWIASLPPKG